MSTGADLRAVGHMAGVLLAETLVNLAEGARPTFAPLVGAARKPGEKFELTFFPDGFADAARRWLQSLATPDAVLVQFPAGKEGDQIRLLAPACDGTERMGFVVALQVAARDGAVETSTPGWKAYNGMPDTGFDPFLEGVGAGLSQHKRAEIFEAGFGALGAFRS